MCVKVPSAKSHFGVFWEIIEMNFVYTGENILFFGKVQSCNMFNLPQQLHPPVGNLRVHQFNLKIQQMLTVLHKLCAASPKYFTTN